MLNFASIRKFSGALLVALALAAPTISRAQSYTITDLGTLGGTQSIGEGINASGQVARVDTTGVAIYHAVIWTGTTITDLNDIAGDSSSPSTGFGINDSGQVAGFSFVIGLGGAHHAVRWTGTTATDLGTLGGDLSDAYGINASGQVVGDARLTGDAAIHAVRWTGKTIADLGTLGGTNSYGSGINRSGAVVGYAYLANGDEHAFYAPGSTMLDLNTLIPTNSGWTLTEALAINDNGWITGQGTINGQQHAFLLTPNTATVTGSIGLEGVADLAQVSPAAPLGAFHIGFRTPGATTEVYSANVALTPIPGDDHGSFTILNVPLGVYDITLKGNNNLRLLLPHIAVSGPTSLIPVILPGGDANNDNSVDSTDFGILIGAFYSDGSIPGSGYDPTVDFNFDGFVDSTDFNILINEFNNTGAR